MQIKPHVTNEKKRRNDNENLHLLLNYLSIQVTKSLNHVSNLHEAVSLILQHGKSLNKIKILRTFYLYIV